MPTFDFIGRDARGMAVDGSLEAATEADVAAILLTRQVTPTSIRSGDAGKRASSSLFGRRERVGVKDLLRISKRLHYLLRAGMELPRALRLLERQERRRPVAGFLSNLRQQVQVGRSLTTAWAATTQKHSAHLLGILKAGESSGSLDQSFGSIAALLERRLALQNKLVSALIYPVILFVAAILTMVLLSTTVIPRFEPIFAQAGAKLPTITRVVMEIAEFVRLGWFPGFVAAGAVAVGLAYMGRQPTGKLAIDRFVLRVPLVGELLTKAAYGRLAHAWSIQLASGVAVTQAMRQGLGGIGNLHVRASMERALERIVAGKSLAHALAQDRSVPVLFCEFVELGEHTGRLPDTLSELAKIYDVEIEQDVQRGMTLITPVATLVLGGMVAMVLTALLSAVMAVNDLAR